MKKAELGDFQTPIELVHQILDLLSSRGLKWNRVLEPTCGRGSFLQGLVDWQTPPSEIRALELQPAYVEEARSIPSPPDVVLEVECGDFFELDFQEIEWKSDGSLLVIGNPPWITNSALGALGSTNLPEKTNFKQLKGLDAMTGQSNFDIAEYIWLKLITDLRALSPTIGLLCKTAVARNVLKFAQSRNLPIEEAAIYRIDAQRWFGAAADACFFLVRLGPGKPSYAADVFDSFDAPVKTATMGFVDGRLVADVDAYKQMKRLEASATQIEWRQGVKHDAAPVMELSAASEGWVNQSGELLDVEDEFIFPLIKASDVRRSEADRPRRGVIVPQRSLRERSEELPAIAPKLWSYLQANRGVFDRRKSSIYKGKSPFAIFGIGPYSFAPYKVIVSGLHKNPTFLVVGPNDEKPVMCDDTCYILPFHSAEEAALTGAALSSDLAKEFIGSIVFWDAKRPITKALLKRIDLSALLSAMPEAELSVRAEEILKALPRWADPTQFNESQLSLGMSVSPIAIEAS